MASNQTFRIKNFYLSSIFIVLSGCLLNTCGYAQSPTWQWATNAGAQVSNSISVDANGNTYVTGFFNSPTVTFGSTTLNNANSGYHDFFIVKYDSNGNVLWAKGAGGYLSDRGNSIYADANGNSYLTGFFESAAITFGSITLTNSGGNSADIFIVKYDSNGNVLWAKSAGGTLDDHGNGITVDVNGNSYLTGDFFSPTITFGSTTLTNSGGWEDTFIVRYDPTGNVVWAKSSEGDSNSDSAYSISVDANGNSYITGFFVNPTVTFGSITLTNTGVVNIFIVKYDSAGDVLWAKNAGGITGFDIGRSISTDAGGNSYVTGAFDSPDITFDGITLTNAGVEDIFIVKYDPTGNALWAISAGETGGAYGNSISTDLNGNSYVTGNFGDSITFGNITLAGTNDIFIVKCDFNGNVIWAIGAEGTGVDSGNSISTDNNGNCYVTGNYGDSIILGSTTLLGGGIFVAKLQEVCSVVGIINQPISQITNVCSNATFSVSINGVPPFQYSWYKNGIQIPTATGSRYTTPVLSLNDNGNTYFCIVSNCNGSNHDTSAIATLTVVPPCIYSIPSIMLNKSTIIPGESLTISGSNFTPNSNIDLTIEDQSGEAVGENIPITYSNPGLFQFVLPVTSAFTNGTYTVKAQDISTGNLASTKIFHVNNIIPTSLEITSPKTSDLIIVNTLFNITWKDFVKGNGASGQSGLIPKTYKVEISSNNGASWLHIENHIAYAHADQWNQFNITYNTYGPGNFIFRVTDLDIPSNTDLSETFNVIGCATGGFTTSLEWDATVPPYIKSIKPHPQGLAADSTARVFVKLNRIATNNKTVSSIDAAIQTVGNNGYNGSALLGKIMYATNTMTYSDEANSANSTTISQPLSSNGNSNAYSFWLVAPDDFTTNLNEESSERKITVTFTVHYSDNTSEVIILCNPIYIYRPALLFVHGIAGDVESFKYTRYLDAQGVTHYFDLSNNWKIVKRINLKEYDSFQNNAKLLLGIDVDENMTFENSIESVLLEMHSYGIANKRVDYVGHSMGGSVARTVINYGNLWYSPGIGQFKNYGNGYINKLITIDTPHNGSYMADYLIDLYPYLTIVPILSYLHDFGFINNNNISPAGLNLQSYSGGIRFGETIVKNHLISADIDPSNNYTEAFIIHSINNKILTNVYNVINFLYPIINLHNTFINRYQNTEFLSQTDGVVQLSSQLAGKDSLAATNIITNPLGIAKTSIIYGIDKMHVGIQKDLAVGTRVKRLLNAQMNSGFFDSSIPANSTPQNFGPGNGQFSLSRTVILPDSINSYYDTNFITIVSPITNTITYVDSVIQLVIHIKDTFGLQSLSVLFQSELYTSLSKDSLQTFQGSIQPELIGKNIVLAKATYDSLGFTINHLDTITIIVSSLDSLEGFYVTPSSKYLNPNQFFTPECHPIYPTFIGLVSPGIEFVSHMIADTNVVVYDSLFTEFVTKDTGTTHIVFTYEGFSDTMFVYISRQKEENVHTICPMGNISFYAGTADSTKTFLWQVDTIDGYNDIQTNSVYSGIDSSTLVITNAPSNWYNNRYRCIISDSIGSSTSKVFTLKFKVDWVGSQDTLWENPLNWNCGLLPDTNTDVFVPSIALHFPTVNSFTFCRSLRLQPGASVEVKTGFQLNTTGGD